MERGGSLVSLPHSAPNQALEPTAYSFGSATLRLRFRRRLTAGVRPITHLMGPQASCF